MIDCFPQLALDPVRLAEQILNCMSVLSHNDMLDQYCWYHMQRAIAL